ncbi:protein SMAX1-LIKE 7-like [Magnolia sinica]|uniref:protein SMAX1-LIKE 7-like n=1 Tax=Magnolia sinica TaxID=86752 RepID=UPI00265AE4EE|nr:protein SMAX1-LIKE 7-like [Magnolia sinica]
MPTPVSAARQCLTGDAARALDDAVSVARRRCHAQTTSLHAISALLALPSSSLRDACARSRTSSFSPRLQFRALDLSFSVALDRLPSSPSISDGGSSVDPPISNSLMAAIKRSQANQRRNPETFFLHHQHQQLLPPSPSSSTSSNSSSSSSVLSVKVDLQPLILSILDDPIVSRVFADAGFRSCDIKLAIVRPLPPLRAPRPRCPPLFLCNFTDMDPTRRFPTFNFPFSSLSTFGFSDFDDNCRRVGEVLARSKGRNPLLVGVCARDAVHNFADCIQRGGEAAVIPKEIAGLKFVCIEKEVAAEGALPGSKLDELGQLVERSVGPGVIISVGDLNSLLTDAAGRVVSGLTKLLELHRERLWLMGAAANYETYMKFLTRYPSVEKDWDLQLLPITSLTPTVGGLYPRPHSLMESFVPFGGFFSTASDLKSPLSSTYPSMFCCHLCNEKYEQEVAAVLKGCTVSVEDQSQGSLPSWLRRADLLSQENGVAEVVKAKDDGTALNDKVMGLQKKWSDNCQRLHRGMQMLEADNLQVGHQVGPINFGLHYIADRKERADNCNSKSTYTSQNPSGCGNAFPMSADLVKISPPDLNKPIPVVPVSKNENLLSKQQVSVSKSELLQTQGLQSNSCTLSEVGIHDGHPSPPLVTSVTTDLVLGTLYTPLSNHLKEPTIQTYKDHSRFSVCSPAGVDLVNRRIPIPMALVQAPSAYSDSIGPSAYVGMRTAALNCQTTAVMVASNPRCLGSSDITTGQCDPRDFKTLGKALTDKVGRQDEAIYAISGTIARCKVGNERRRGASLKGDIWFSLLGPDRVGKKRVAVALAEMVFGSKQNLICVDLNSQDGITCSNSIFDLSQATDGFDAGFRGKTVVDHIAWEISKKPWSVVFLENVDKADLMLQNSLSQAIRTGKFPDSHGREVGINNTIFITTMRTWKGKMFSDGKESVDFSEDRILAAQVWEMHISVGSVPEAVSNKSSNVLVMPRNGSGNEEYSLGRVFVKKRKLDSTGDHKTECEYMETAKRLHRTSNTYLDLNLSAEEMEANNTDNGDDENDRMSESSEAWLEEFIDKVDETVTFKAYDFDTVADNVLKKIRERFQSALGSEGMLEVDCKVMEQILAAEWVLEGTGAVKGWIEKVLGQSFVEARERYASSLWARTVLRLETCEEGLMEEQAPGVCLPARIILN